MNYISTWLYIENEFDKSYYPQVGGTSASKNIQDIYWKCVFSFFHSSLKFNKNSRHIFFTNANVNEINIDSINLYTFFKENNIEIVSIDLTNKTPVDWFGAWRNQFYLFDILNYIKLNFKSEDNFIILDSDCVFTREISDIFEDISKYQNLCLRLGYDKYHSINGINKLEMTSIYNEIFDTNEELIEYYGGEFFASTYNSICEIVNRFEYLWTANYERYEKKCIKLNEEAHFLSCLYKSLGITNEYGNKFTKRMWTAFKYSNIETGDENLPIWHLPAEKRTGFVYLFKYISKDYKKYLEIEDHKYICILKKSFGIPNKLISKQIRDIKEAVIRKVKDTIKAK